MSHEKKILLIMTALFAGGAEKQYRYIMEALSESSSVSVLLLNQPIKGKEDFTRNYILQHGSIEFFQLDGDALNMAKSGRINEKLGKIRSLFLQWCWLRRYLRNHKVDAVMFTYVTQLLMVPLFNKYGIKSVFNERNTGRQVCDKGFKIKLLQKCTKVIANSEYASNYIHEKAGIDVSVYKNGVKIDSIEKKEHTAFNILVPARINRIKNQKAVADAIRLLKDRLPQSDYDRISVVFAGMIEENAYLEEIKQVIQRDSLNITIPGYVEQMSDLYEKTDLLILPSYEEGTPNVLLEAYMYRIDALVSDIPMNVSCCTDREMLFSPEDPVELAERIATVLKTKKPEAYYDNNYRYLLEHYGINQMKERYLNLFAGL